MISCKRILRTCATAVALASGGTAAIAQQLPPIRQISAVVSRFADSLGALPEINVLGNGGAIINDRQSKRMLLVDAFLRVERVILDTTSTAAHRYTVPGNLLRYRGDSTLFIDPSSASLLLISPTGTIARVVSMPAFASTAQPLTNGLAISVADPDGRLIAMVQPTPPPRSDSAAFALFQATMGAPHPDSVAIVRMSLASRFVDTIAYAAYGAIPPAPPPAVVDGLNRTSRVVLPFGPPVEHWIVTHDGSVGVVRMSDYHIDWTRPDGSQWSTAKIAHDWRRLSDAEKQHISDSVQRLADSTNAVAIDNALKAKRGSVSVSQVEPVSEFPDYAPPFGAGPPREDADGNVWIPASFWPVIAGGQVYDIVNSKGLLVDRVQLPGGTTLLGLGHNVAFVASRIGPFSSSLVTMRVH